MSEATPTDLRSIIAKAGGTNKVARACGVTSGAVSHWVKAGCLPLKEVKGETQYARKLIDLSGLRNLDEWDVRLIGRR